MMRIIPRYLCQEWVLGCLLVQCCLSVGLMWLYSQANTSTLRLRCTDNKRVSYNLHMSAEETGEGGGKRVIEEAFESNDVFERSDDFLPLDPEKGQYDKWRKFRTQMHVTVGNDWSSLSKQRLTCLGAQTSLDRLYSLTETLEEWSGPISIALFVADVEYVAAKVYIDSLSDCYEDVKNQVSFHYTYPKQYPLKYDQELNDKLVEFVQKKLLRFRSREAQCKELVSSSKFFTEIYDLAVNSSFQDKQKAEKFKAWRQTLAYPQNLLRNTAKTGCQTEYTLIPDVDMIPNHKMDIQLEDFLRNRQPEQCKSEESKCAFVIPVYEISDNAIKRPSVKEDLIKLIKNNPPLARGFHSKLFSLNQKSSNLPRWEKLNSSQLIDNLAPKLNVGYEVTSDYKFRYEPMYVARANTPQFDERFIGFGMTRNTQAYEMFVAGYQFYVLDNAFASHWGFQSIKTRPKWRAKQQEDNNKKFDDFAREITARYGGKDPYNMIGKLKSLNLKNIHVGYGKTD